MTRVLFVTPELAPFAKVGGLGDVGAALPRALHEAGHEVLAVAPLYRRAREGAWEFATEHENLSIQLGPRSITFDVRTAPLPGSDLLIRFIDCPPLYDRPSIYGNDDDEHLRFAALTWAALRICQHTQWSPDIAHVNDWQTALLPLILKTVLAWDRLFEGTRSVFTIHNIGHQGTFGAHVLPELGLAPAAGALHQDDLHDGRINSLLHAILYADAITTVSPTYAEEIKTPEGGVGLDPYLRARGTAVQGILNGIDTKEWSPETDPYLPHHYSAGNLSGKNRCKQKLCKELGLSYDKDRPLFGIVSRLVWQKGLDLCEQVLPHFLARNDVSLAVLGSGEPRYEQFFHQLQVHFPGRVCFYRGYNEALSRLIEAGSDLFLMPSRYEPCGLNQMYSLAYGAVPVVHRTGGLADTVRLYAGKGSDGNGVIFDHFTTDGLSWALSYALRLWGTWERGAWKRSSAQRSAWRALQKRGMTEDFSWDRRVREYESLYNALIGEPSAETGAESTEPT